MFAKSRRISIVWSIATMLFFVYYSTTFSLYSVFMKKIISILLLAVFVSANFSFGMGPTETPIGDIIETNQEATANTETPTTTPSKNIMGITCNENQLVNGQCKLNIYDTLGIRKSVRDEGDPTSVGLFVQDVILSATLFIWTLVTITLIVSGLMFIFAASSGKDPANAKKWIVGSLVGLLLVVSSYVIIRLVQYIAKGF